MAVQERGLLESLVGRIKGRAWLDSVPYPPHQIAEDLWTIEGWRVKLGPGLVLPSRSTVVRLSSGGVVLFAAPPFVEETRKAVEAIGPLRFIIAPNTFHHLNVGAWVASTPSAQVYLAPGLRRRQPQLPPATDLDPSATRPWGDDLADAVLGPIRSVSEVVFLHRPSGTLITTDLCFHLVEARTFRERIAWMGWGYPKRLGPSRSGRLLVLRPRALTRPFLNKVLEWHFDRIIMAHGEIVEREGYAVFRRAFSKYLQ